MPRKPENVTDAELAVLEELWPSGSATIRAITDLVAGQWLASRSQSQGPERPPRS